jgi:hypothetical protein
MGFHKRWINEEILIGNYRRQGIEGVRMLWSADAIITNFRCIDKKGIQ